MRIILSQINPRVGDLKNNQEKISSKIHDAKMKGADLIVFPELSLTGYPPEDLLLFPDFIEACQQGIEKISEETKDIVAIVGFPRKNINTKGKPLYNSAAILSEGKIIGFQDKRLLPTYDVFDESRYFEKGGPASLWKIKNKVFAVSICEDIWGHSYLEGDITYKEDPVVDIRKLKPDFLINISASPYSLNRKVFRYNIMKKAAHTLSCPILLCNQVGGNDSLIFDGSSLCITSDGNPFGEALSFKEDDLLVDLSKIQEFPFKNETEIVDLYQALKLGVRDYFNKLGFKRACLGLSGGIDSALVACIGVDALGKENIRAVSMPSRYTSLSSIQDAEDLAKKLEIRLDTIPIEGPFESYLKLLNPFFDGKAPDVTEENLQARIRGMILMALSNKHGEIVLSTGNKSELALGYSTLYGDLCGGLAVISDVTKTKVYKLASWINREKELIPHNILIKAPSAELKENQKDSDSLPDYAIIDAVLEDYVERHLSATQIAEKNSIDLELVKSLIVRIHKNEYKRRQSAPGLRVSLKAFSIGRRFPIVQGWV